MRGAEQPGCAEVTGDRTPEQRPDRENAGGRQHDFGGAIRARAVVWDSPEGQHRHEDGGERGLHDDMDHRGAIIDVLDPAQQEESPRRRARRGDQRQPQPVAQPRERMGRRADDADIDYEGPRARIGGLHEQRRDQRSGKAETGECGPMQRRRGHAGEADGAEREERRRRADEMIERIGRIDRAESRDRAGRGQHSRNVGGARVALGLGVAAAQELTRSDQNGGEQESERDAHGRTEHATFDRQAHQQNGAERKCEAADPDGPARSDRFLEAAASGRRLGRLRCSGRGVDLHDVAVVGNCCRNGFRLGGRGLRVGQGRLGVMRRSGRRSRRLLRRYRFNGCLFDGLRLRRGGNGV